MVLLWAVLAQCAQEKTTRPPASSEIDKGRAMLGECTQEKTTPLPA
jgi:hypothetical protein